MNFISHVFYLTALGLADGLKRMPVAVIFCWVQSDVSGWLTINSSKRKMPAQQ